MKYRWIYIFMGSLLTIVLTDCNRKKIDPDDIAPGRMVVEQYQDNTPKTVVFYKLDKNGKMTNEKIREVSYYSDKKKYIEVNFKDGQRDGVWKSYFPDGQVQSEQYYANSKLNGAYNIYYENGKTHLSGQYKEGICVGTWIIYNQNGTVKQRLEANDNTVCCQGCSRCVEVRSKLLNNNKENKN